MAVEDLMILRYEDKNFSRFAGNLTGAQKLLGNTEKSINSLESRLGKLGSSPIAKLGGGSGVFNIGSAAAVGALGLIGKASISAAGDLEATKAGFESVLGSASKASDLYKQIANFSLISPANNAAVARSAQLLLATGTAAKDIVPTLHAVGNAVAFSGAKDQTEKVIQITQILAKLGARGKITARELNQIATRNLNPYKILRDELGLTAEQIANIGREGVTAAEAVPALLRGFEKLGGGKAMERMNKTFVGQMSQMQDAADQLEATLGGFVIPRLTPLIQDVTAATQKLNALAKAHPRAFNLIATGAGVAGAGLIAGAAVNKGTSAASGLVKMFGLTTNARKKAAGAAKLLESATLGDLAAESKKAGIAGIEEKAIGKGADTALRAASAKETLANQTAEAAKKAGLLARVGNLARNPISIGGTSLATSGAFGGGSGAFGALGSLGAQGGAKAMGLVTGAGALASGAAGLVAGVSATNNMKAAGYTDGQAYMYGAATGIGAAGAAMFLPGGAVAVGVGEGLGALINHFYNKPAEATAKAGTGAQGDTATRLAAAQKSGDHRTQQDIYDQMAADAFAKSDTVSAESYRLTALGQGRAKHRAAQYDSPENLAAQRARQADLEKRFTPGSRNPTFDNGMTPHVRVGRDGSRTITFTTRLPESSGDASARKARYNTLTPAPLL